MYNYLFMLENNLIGSASHETSAIVKKLHDTVWEVKSVSRLLVPYTYILQIP
jgi:hypothetical protein